MVSRDYTKEIGLNSDQPVVPMPIAMAIVAVLVVCAWVGHSVLVPAGQPAAVKSVAVAPAHAAKR